MPPASQVAPLISNVGSTMFCTDETLKCTGCSQVFAFPLGDHCVYSTGDLDLSHKNLAESPAFHPVLRRRAWCVKCDSPVLVERLPSTVEFMNAAALARSSSTSKPCIDDELIWLPLEEQQFLFGRLSTRTSNARCLQCGSTEWFGIEVIDGKLQPPLLHQNCNSPLEWRGIIASVVRRAGTVKVRAYSFNGELLAEGVL